MKRDSVVGRRLVGKISDSEHESGAWVARATVPSEVSHSSVLWGSSLHSMFVPTRQPTAVWEEK